MSQLAHGIKLRDHGIANVEANNADWLATMRHKARQIAKADNQVSMNDLREYGRAEGIEPNHPNAAGAIFKEPGWKAVGWVQATTASCRGRWIRKWARISESF